MKFKNHLLKNTTLTLGFLLTSFILPVSVSAKVAPPTPPAENPHTPSTQADKARVSFAINAVKLLLMKGNNKNAAQDIAILPQGGLTPDQLEFMNKDLNCIKDPSCYERDVNFMNELAGLNSTYGKVVQIKHAHIIPWSFENFLKNRNTISKTENHIMLAEVVAAPPADKPTHNHGATYFEPPLMKAPQLKPDEYMVHLYVQFDKQAYWHHLDVILSEDNEGKISLRHFFVAPMMASLPPGVVC